MTPLRPEHEAGQDGPYEQGTYEAAGVFEAAVDRLADPLNDPLPGQHASPWFRADNIRPEEAGAPEAGRGRHRSPAPQQWSEAGEAPRAQPSGPPPAEREAREARGGPESVPDEWYDPQGFERDWYGQQGPAAASAPAPVPPVRSDTSSSSDASSLSYPDVSFPADDGTAVLRAVHEPDVFPADERTAVLPVVDGTGFGPDPVPPKDPEGAEGFEDPEQGPEGPGRGPGDAAPEPRPGGRAERRRAAKGRGRRRADAPAWTAPPAAAQADRPMSRVEARRAARAAKDSPAVVASRFTGELFITLGVLMLLFVTYQLWWTNVRANQYAGKETNKIQDDWAKGDRNPGVFEAGQGFAIIHIPKLDVVAPIAEGINKEKVLDRGMIGHYSEGSLRTAMPSAETGNFALAGHRNTHGEPFRYINRLEPGDPIVVETQDAYYTYEMAKMLPQTSPSNVSVIDPVPAGSGFTEPGRYLTLTTCTPEFTSTYRLIVWGKMVDERPRSKGKPDALVG
ncbi:class E sortase [Streptomyces sp. NPDC014685]|uniref:class E sortase n=1 Tax=Streptomyces sp. NPDC014685 TaxID=3364881 RepID=UPI003701001C